MARIDIAFTNVNGVRKAQVPTGQLKVTKVPGHGWMGVHVPWQGRSQVFVPAGKVRLLDDAIDATVSAWRQYVGLDEIRSFV